MTATWFDATGAQDFLLYLVLGILLIPLIAITVIGIALWMSEVKSKRRKNK